MKKLISFPVLATLSVLLTYCTKESKEVRMMDIQPHELALTIDSANFENKEVKVFKTKPDDYHYTVVMCHDYSGKKKKYRATVKDKVSYDQASIVWTNDTTIDINLIDSKTNEKYSYIR